MSKGTHNQLAITKLIQHTETINGRAAYDWLRAEQNRLNAVSIKTQIVTKKYGRATFFQLSRLP